MVEEKIIEARIKTIDSGKKLTNRDEIEELK
jgi:hypothetical protein